MLHIKTLDFSTNIALHTISEYRFSVTADDTVNYVEGWWGLIDKNKEIIISNINCFASSNTPPPVAPIPGFLTDGTCNSLPLTWKILKLSDRKMWLVTNFQNNTYEVHLKQQ
jgi:hypothetical protein